ncbi:hypothetical protein K6Y31_05260 [Motilimonas cestriensis]|uniref:Uncharacterized protein n=1 Tax=Motilimonas cestriensis TaxID=2742685 RepID=A0ABS8W6V1_9GAMM|nr:hypothetical protein [Motilimonas cestriensis]MCE2594220.1 hypothetical protein [Motilimonas cestriensis]
MILLLLEIICVWLIVGNLILLFSYRQALRQFWLEPMVKQPIIIFESDDWGPGPAEHGQALHKIHQLLTEFRDYRGHCAHMTIGAVLSIPDAEKIQQSQYQAYAGLDLSQPQFSDVLGSLKQGQQAGVFSLQLHGREHYWPHTLLSEMQHNNDLKEWLAHNSAYTEKLPSPLQSRWNPPLSIADIAVAVKQEVDLFKRCFGVAAEVVVPPTFVWNEEVEISWRSHGIHTIITPGQRYYKRSETRFWSDKKRIVNHQTSATGQTYLVRNQYFEPEFGHQWREAIDKVTSSIKLARPCLFETHRFNFVNSEEGCQNSLYQMRSLLEQVTKTWPDCCFLSSLELVRLPQHDPDKLLIHHWRHRLQCWRNRAFTLPKFRYLATLTGLNLACWLIVQVKPVTDFSLWQHQSDKPRSN